VTNDVALFEGDGSMFALVPGGTHEIGFEAGPWEPTKEEAESWAGTAEEYGIETSLREHVASATLGRRTVTLAPFFIETRAAEVGWRDVPVEDPDVRDAVKGFAKKRGRGSVEFGHGGRRFKVARDDAGLITARQSTDPTHAALSADLARKGFRFPTADEWEYLCGGGSASLFRWGDHVPCDRYPTDISPAEAAWRREWVLSNGKLEYPANGFEPDFDLHRRPGALGVYIASDPYKMELTTDPKVTRGGDGGAMICGGAGFFVGWLPLATAYFESHACEHEAGEPVAVGYAVGRRVLAL
jgi:hypothetical protein